MAMKIIDIPTIDKAASAELRELYSEPHRFYHNTKHIEDMLANADKSEYPPNHPIYIAIAYHDAVYYPQSKRNEELSRWLFTAHADAYGFEMPNNRKMDVRRAIMATKNHTHEDWDSELPWIKEMLDFDLWGLGNSYEEFEHNTVCIYAEFKRHVTMRQFCHGRINFFNKLIERPLFRVHADREKQARENIRVECSKLLDYKWQTAFEERTEEYILSKLDAASSGI
ncbi:putative metal-dependent phosphohydrolase protein [Rhizobium phage RHEph12]|nr:putative metal-dependent phosphohydrolase protein [Rhizobium phage RHEph12]